MDNYIGLYLSLSHSTFLSFKRIDLLTYRARQANLVYFSFSKKLRSARFEYFRDSFAIDVKNEYNSGLRDDADKSGLICIHFHFARSL